MSATSGVWNFSQIRHCNYFLEQVLPKHEAGEIQGSAANIRHYIGEIYLIRAYAYFNMLQNIGDCPIVETALPDQEEVLVEASKRQPRHKVARFILSDLDKAAQMLLETSPAGKTRVGKSVAHLLPLAGGSLRSEPGSSTTKAPHSSLAVRAGRARPRMPAV